MTNESLVSIIVLTYNSSKYVVETLESAFLQSYRNIELLIADDSSSDNTVEICENWGILNSGRFAKFLIIKSRHNQGIASNCNKGVCAANGEWVKLIAGDDILLPNCVEDYIAFAKVNPNARIIVGGVECFGSGVKSVWFPPSTFQRKNAYEQYRYQLRYGSTIMGVSPFIKKAVFDEIGAFNEDYQYWEDFPFYLKATQNNIKIFTLLKLIVKYRVHQESILRTPNGKFDSSYRQYVKEVVFPLSRKEGMYFFYWHQKLNYLFADGVNRFPFKYLIIRYLLVALLDPYRYYLKINKVIQKLVG